MIAGEGFRLRPIAEADLPWVEMLAAKPEVADFLAAVSPWREEAVRVTLAADPQEQARWIVEVEEGGSVRPAGAVGFELANRRSRIAYLYGLMIDPAFRGHGLAERVTRALAWHLIRGLGFHRVQLEVYGFNEQALRVFERAGFTLEGRRRLAYARQGTWVDGVLFGLVEEDLGAAAASIPP